MLPNIGYHLTFILEPTSMLQRFRAGGFGNAEQLPLGKIDPAFRQAIVTSVRCEFRSPRAA
jgi:hypothetical protein